MVVAICVRLRCRGSGREVVVRAVVNSAYESSRPEILLPLSVVEELGLSRDEGVVVEKVLADGSRRRFVKVCDAVEVSVVTGDRVVGPVVADVLISERGRRVLISDSLASMLGIVLLDLREGLWCFRDELGVKVRR